MKTNGLIGKKAKCARAAWRNYLKEWPWDRVGVTLDSISAVRRWHQAQRGRK